MIIFKNYIKMYITRTSQEHMNLSAKKKILFSLYPEAGKV